MPSAFPIGAFGIIFNAKGEVLLCHRTDKDLWNLPGGGANPGEPPWQTVLREIQEEIRVNARIVRLSGVYFKPQKSEIVFSFLCTIDGEPKTSNEADEVRFFHPDALPPNTVAKQVQRIQDYLSGPEKIFFKIQQD